MIKFGNTFVNFNGTYIIDWTSMPNPNPLNLPAYTIRLKYKDNVVPTFSKGTGVQVSSSPNIWDLTYENSSWLQLLMNQSNLLEVLGANTSNVTNMIYMFYGCSSLTSVSIFDTSNVTEINAMFYGCSSLTAVPLFDTSSVTNMIAVFNGCTSLTTIPLFDTSKATNMSQMFDSCTSLTSIPLFNTSNNVNMQYMFRDCISLTTIPLFDTSKVGVMSQMFYNCINVQSGALALYQQASTQAKPPSVYYQAFYQCGRDTETGSAELAQIPSDWK